MRNHAYIGYVCFVSFDTQSNMLTWLLVAYLLMGVDSQGNPPPGTGGVAVVLNFGSPIMMCDDELSMEFADTSRLDTSLFNESTACINGIMEFKKTLGPTTMMKIVLEKEANGRYELAMNHDICNLCEELGNPESPYYSYLKESGLPDACPIELGEYNFNNMAADTSDLPINSANIGRYKATMNFYDNPSGDCQDEVVFLGCMHMVCYIEPLEK